MRLPPHQSAFLVAVVAMIVTAGAILALPAGTAAQAPLVLADFDTTGYETELLALIAVGDGGDTLWRREPRGADVSTLVDGEMGLGTDNQAVTEARRETDLSTLTLNDSSGPFSLAAFFGSGGDGADLTLRLQSATSSGTGTIDADRVGGGFAVFNIDTDGTVLLAQLNTGDRFIIALTRSAPIAATPPAQVTGVSAAAVAHDTITVSWTELAEATGYVVRRDTDASFSSPSEANAAATGYRITGLSEDTEYHVQVKATKRGAADGEWSQPAATARTALQPPAQVTGLTGQAVSDVAIALSWGNAARASGYIVQWRKSSEGFNDQRQATTTQLSYNLTRLDPRTTYFFAVTSTRAGASNGPRSSTRFATTLAAQIPGQVTGLSAAAISDREIAVTWTAATNAEGYIVQWRADGDSFAADRQAEITETQVIIEQLKAETEYFVRAAGTRRSAANGPWSAEDSAMTPIAGFTRAILRFPGGNPVAAQLSLVAFAGVLSGIKFRSHKSPKRETLILGFMCAASLILPILGIGSIFWTGGIVILVGLAAACVFFLKGRV